MISDPIEFCKEMECSGVSNLDTMLSWTHHSFLQSPRTYIGLPSCGLKNLTPSSVTLANFNKLTI